MRTLLAIAILLVSVSSFAQSQMGPVIGWAFDKEMANAFQASAVVKNVQTSVENEFGVVCKADEAKVRITFIGNVTTLRYAVHCENDIKLVIKGRYESYNTETKEYLFSFKSYRVVQ